MAFFPVWVYNNKTVCSPEPFRRKEKGKNALKFRFGKKDILTIPNLLSLFRILLIPQIVWLYAAADRGYAALAAVALSAVTDVADGFIARHFHMVSELGKVLDPIADKLTQAALLICLAFRYPVLYWVFALFALKEILQGLLGLAVVKATGKMQFARWYGKLSTVVFYSTMFLLLLPVELPAILVHILILLCTAALMLAMICYTRDYLAIVWNALFPGSSRRSLGVRLFMLCMWIAAVIFFWLHRDCVSMDGALRIEPRSTVLAVLLMLGLFALKSFSVVIHAGLLYAVCGVLFPLPMAITVNVLGTLLMAGLSYGLGRQLGGSSIDGIVQSHRNAVVLRQLRRENTFVYTALTRLINLLPFDVISAYFGATQTPLVPYLLGSAAGMAAACVLFPLMGASIVDIRSPRFIISASLEAALLLGSLLTLLAVRGRFSPEGAEKTEGP